jgi:hypothetical protein
MKSTSAINAAARGLALTAAVAAASYGAYAGVTWWRYGHPRLARTDERDELLDRFMPQYDIVERHHVMVAAPAEVTLAAAKRMELSSSPLIRAIFRARELLLGATPDTSARPRGLLEETLSLGWGVLEDVPRREIVVGAVTKPWEPNVTFRALPPDEFASFAEPEYVKIAWTLRADPVDDHHSVFRTETRAIATDAYAQEKFRLYWAFLSPGILLIRRLMLGPMKRAAIATYQGAGRAQDGRAGQATAVTSDRRRSS